MISVLARKLFGSANDRRIRSYRPRVEAINALEPELEALSDEALRARTEAFKEQLGLDAKLVSVGNNQCWTAANADHIVLAFRGTEAPTSIEPYG